MDNEISNKINLDELSDTLINNPEQVDELLNTISDTEELEDLYDVLFSKSRQYDKSYNSEHNKTILQIHKKISARIDQLKSYNLLKGLKEEHSVLEGENQELSEELSREENSNEIGE